MSAQVTRMGAIEMQVCVLACRTDAEIKEFAENSNPCGTELGWQIRKTGDEALYGIPERNPCAKRDGYVHVTLDA